MALIYSIMHLLINPKRGRGIYSAYNTYLMRISPYPSRNGIRANSNKKELTQLTNKASQLINKNKLMNDTRSMTQHDQHGRTQTTKS